MRKSRALRVAYVAARAAAATAWVGLSASACSFFFAAPKPMRAVAASAYPNRPSRCVMVFLPGFGDSAESYAEHGFIDALRARGLMVDTVETEATFGYYANRTVLTRLREDVLPPIRAKGYEQIWIVGTSMGGMGALLLATRERENLAGVVLIAPYLGDATTLQEIDGAGGLASWHPERVASDDYQRLVWLYLQGLTARPDARPALYLAGGDADKLRYGIQILSRSLPADRVFRTEGTHDWGPWSVLWAHFLDGSDFRARCGRPDR
jgi:pimeloyl-ACP methyl ester carboxylesterase